MKILNLSMKNTTTAISSEQVVFDANGVGEIKSQRIFDAVIKLSGFSAVKQVEIPTRETIKKSVEETPSKGASINITSSEPKIEKTDVSK